MCKTCITNLFPYSQGTTTATTVTTVTTVTTGTTTATTVTTATTTPGGNYISLTQQGRNQDLNLAKQNYESLTSHKNCC